ncbi:MAG: hypothetical protein JST69_09980 [Bacteroidetes bacterium]|nr:hypothetical protein [Bacteroidota bacterium]
MKNLKKDTIFCDYCGKKMSPFGSTYGYRKRYVCYCNGKKKVKSVSRKDLTGRSLDPYIIVRILQLRYEQLSYNRIGKALHIYYRTIGPYVQKYLNSPELVRMKGMRHQVRDGKRFNLLREKLETISQNYLLDDSKPFIYEILLIDKNRFCYTVRRNAHSYIDHDWIGFKCRQLFLEGFPIEGRMGIASILELPAERVKKFITEEIEIETNQGENHKRLWEHKMLEGESRHIEYVELDGCDKDVLTGGRFPFEFYMNIKVGKGKIKSISSVYPGLQHP